MRRVGRLSVLYVIRAKAEVRVPWTIAKLAKLVGLTMDGF